ncbi:MAG: hypothetical protein J6Y84_03950 [Bacteroidaceae bacterium]|nr:hypothetical protein [Bacteroidaceae bacterium]
MKKEYIKPEMLDEILLTESLMLGGSDTPATDNPDDDLSNGRRGRWGNLWDEE